jgi:RHH-type proline utilization regulon transcriptional repressor/proline dehydrogenase/delta 1-pyrroline-5-carboxylate dehydrogenase
LAAELLEAAQEIERSHQARRRRRLGRLVANEASRVFVQDLTDQVPRIGDARRAAERFHDIVTRRGVPAVAGPLDRLALSLGARAAPLAPGPVMALVNRRLRQEADGVILPAEDPALGRHLARRRGVGYGQNVNPLGEAVLGEDEARRRLETVLATIERPDVDYVSVKITAIYSQVDPLAFDHTVDVLSQRLRTLYRTARAAGTFVNLDMEAYDDLQLTVAAFRRVLDEPEFADLDAGIVQQAYLPDSVQVLRDLVAWGHPLKVRIVKGANLAMERVEAELRGWPQAPYETKAEVDANAKRLLDLALDSHLRVGVGSHNLFDVAWAMVRAEEAGATGRVELEMLEGMAPAQAEAVRRRAGDLLLYAPVVAHDDFQAAIAYLVRRLDENTAPENFLHHLFTLEPGSPDWADQQARFSRSVAERDAVSERSRRDQDRSTETRHFDPDGRFANEPDTDFTSAANRRWVAAAVARWRPPPEPAGADVALVDATVRRVHGWADRPEPERRRVLHRVAEVLAARRGEAIAVMVKDAGKTVAEADPEVSEAIDFATWYAHCGREISELTGPDLVFEPYRRTVVASPWNFPLAIPAGGVLAALAAGSGVILKPAPQAVAVARFLVDCCHDAGVPDDVLVFLPTPEDDAGRRLITHPEVDAVILTGSWETAQLFHSWDPSRRLHAETSGKNAMVITATADLDAAIADLVHSAFSHSGQKCSAASLALVEASVHDGPHFLRRLADAVRSLRVGPATDPATRVGPLIGPPEGSLARAFRQLDEGESWLVPPDGEGPAVRIGVRPGSWFHQTECFGPVLGVIRVADLDAALEVQNAVAFGLTGGLHSLDPAEVDHWVDRVEVGNAYVNRHTTGAIVGRQPFGGWKRSSVGPTAKAGGPDYVLCLGRWRCPDGPSLERARATFAPIRDQDLAGLRAEANLLRHRPLPKVVVRVDDTVSATDLEVARLAAATVGATVEVQTDDGLDLAGATRLRLLGRLAVDVYAAAHAAGVTVDDNPVVDHGRIELRRWVREQVVSRTRHRYGTVTS